MGGAGGGRGSSEAGLVMWLMLLVSHGRSSRWRKG